MFHGRYVRQNRSDTLLTDGTSVFDGETPGNGSGTLPCYGWYVRKNRSDTLLTDGTSVFDGETPCNGSDTLLTDGTSVFDGETPCNGSGTLPSYGWYVRFRGRKTSVKNQGEQIVGNLLAKIRGNKS